MTGHRSWTADRRARMAEPEVAQRAAAAHAGLARLEEGCRKTLAQLRNAHRLTQAQLASVLGVSQAQVSRVENQADLYLSTLRSYVQAMGGELEVRAFFPDGQTAAIMIADLQNPADADAAGRHSQLDVHAAFALVHRGVGRIDSDVERFRAAGAV